MPPVAIELPPSELVLGAALEKKQLLDLLAEHIPATLAHEKRRPIGSPGEVTYTVTRGAMDARVNDGALEVTTLANAQIEVCKPLGPFCVTYGRCRPVLATTVSMPALLTPDYSWQHPTSRVEATRGCSIAGFDVTSRLVSIARSNLSTIRSRVEHALPDVRPWAARLWELSRLPVFLDKDHCLRITPRQLLQSPPEEAEGELRVRLGAELDLEVATDCAEKGSEIPLAPLATRERLPAESTLWLSQSISVKSAASQLTRALSGAFGTGQKVSDVEVIPARLDGRNALMLGVGLDGSVCGTAWLAASLDAAPGGAVHLANVEFLNAPIPKALEALPAHLTSKARLEPDLGFDAVGSRLLQLFEALAVFPDDRVQLNLRMQAPLRTLPTIDDTGLTLSAEARLTIEATLGPSSP